MSGRLSVSVFRGGLARAVAAAAAWVCKMLRSWLPSIVDFLWLRAPRSAAANRMQIEALSGSSCMHRYHVSHRQGTCNVTAEVAAAVATSATNINQSKWVRRSQEGLRGGIPCPNPDLQPAGAPPHVGCSKRAARPSDTVPAPCRWRPACVSSTSKPAAAARPRIYGIKPTPCGPTKARADLITEIIRWSAARRG